MLMGICGTITIAQQAGTYWKLKNNIQPKKTRSYRNYYFKSVSSAQIRKTNQNVKLNYNIIDVAMNLGLEIRSNKSRCFHPENHANGDRTPSLSFSPSRGIYKCFGCGIGGDVFTLVQQVKGCSFPEAYCFITGEKFAPRRGGIDKSISSEEIDNICNFIYRNKLVPETYPCDECLDLFENTKIAIDDDFITRVVKCAKCGTKSRLDYCNGDIFEYRRLS